MNTRMSNIFCAEIFVVCVAKMMYFVKRAKGSMFGVNHNFLLVALSVATETAYALQLSGDIRDDLSGMRARSYAFVT